jgi:hypothetical protein
MEKGIYGLAFLQYNFERFHHDIIDAYIPLFCHCLVVMQAETAEMLAIRNSLKDEYGLTNITDGAIISIFDRMTKEKYGLLKLQDGIYFVNKEKVAVEGNKHPKDNLVAGFDEMVDKIEAYSKDFPVAFNKQQIEEGLLHFMDQYDVDLTLGNVQELCEQLTKYKKEEKRLKYIISKFLIEADKNEPETVNLMVKLAKGHAISSLVCLQDLNKMNGNLKEVEVYLDAPIIFNLLKLNDEANYHLANELMQLLQDNGAKFCIFNHNYNEVVCTMTDARDRLLTNNYDLRKSSRLLKMAHREGITGMQIDVKLQEFSTILEQWKVEIKGRPDLQEGGYDIDVITLSEIIKDVYTNKGTRNLFYNELNMLDNDVNSITYIYRLRGNVACTSLKNSKALLLSTNRVISSASHDKRINILNHAIPACSTDVFLSTIMWTNYPSSSDGLNQKLLMSECYNGVEIDDQLMMRFYDQLKQQQSNGQISEALFLQATTSNIALKLLADRTLNDINAYTDRTASEVLEIIEEAHKSELDALEEKLNKEKADLQAEADKMHESDQNTIKGLREDLTYHKKNIEKLSNSLASIITGLIIAMLFAVFLSVKLYPKPENCSLPVIYLYWFGWILVAFWAVLSWSGIIPQKAQIHRIVKEWLFKKLNNWLNKKE